MWHGPIILSVSHNWLLCGDLLIFPLSHVLSLLATTVITGFAFVWVLLFKRVTRPPGFSQSLQCKGRFLTLRVTIYQAQQPRSVVFCFFIAIRVCYFKAVNLGLNVQPVEPCCLKRVVFYFIAFAAFMPLIATLFGLLFWFFKFYLTFWTALNSHVNSKCASKIFCCCTGTAEFSCLRAALPLKLQKASLKGKKNRQKK